MARRRTVWHTGISAYRPEAYFYASTSITVIYFVLPNLPATRLNTQPTIYSILECFILNGCNLSDLCTLLRTLLRSVHGAHKYQAQEVAREAQREG